MTERLPNTQKEVEECLAEIEAEVGVGPDGTKAVCEETGEPFVTICWDLHGDFIKLEGDQGATFQTEELAWAFWFLAFKQYRQGREGKIYWRKRPEVTMRLTFSQEYVGLARLFIGAER